MERKMNLEHLIEQIERGTQFKYLCFWGHTPKQASIVDKSCLSQWFVAPFEIDGQVYQTAEHYMMAQKAKLFDASLFDEIVNASHPNEAKKLGRQVKNYDENVWQAQRFNIVVDANLAKFSQHTALKDFLIATQNRVLVEASPVDKIWGIGLAQEHAHAEQPKHWKGLNLLGFALMQVRQQLIDNIQ